MICLKNDQSVLIHINVVHINVILKTKQNQTENQAHLFQKSSIIKELYVVLLYHRTCANDTLKWIVQWHKNFPPLIMSFECNLSFSPSISIRLYNHQWSWNGVWEHISCKRSGFNSHYQQKKRWYNLMVLQCQAQHIIER